MPSFDNLNGLAVFNSFHFVGTSDLIADGNLDTSPYSKMYAIVSYLQAGSAITDFYLGESDTGGGPYTPVETVNLIGSDYSEFLLSQGALVPFLNENLPAIGWFGTKRYISLNWTTSNVGDVEILVTINALLKTQIPYQSG